MNTGLQVRPPTAGRVIIRKWNGNKRGGRANPADEIWEGLVVSGTVRREVGQ